MIHPTSMASSDAGWPWMAISARTWLLGEVRGACTLIRAAPPLALRPSPTPAQNQQPPSTQNACPPSPEERAGCGRVPNIGASASPSPQRWEAFVPRVAASGTTAGGVTGGREMQDAEAAASSSPVSTY
jgi:hypothetical protein